MPEGHSEPYFPDDLDGTPSLSEKKLLLASLMKDSLAYSTLKLSRGHINETPLEDYR
jgi:hypothetical protein